MIPVYLDVSNEAKRQINENVWCMFDLLEATCEGLSYEEILDGIFPPYIVDINLDKCVKTIKELYNMTRDKFERDYLSPFYEWTLYRTVLWWMDVREDIELNEISKEICISNDGCDLYAYLNNVENYLEFLFQDWDFLYVEEIYAIYKRNPSILERYLHIDIKQYIELMPSDIQKEYEKGEGRDMQTKGNITVNINGGQVNYATDNATINAIQNNGVCANELETIIDAIKNDLTCVKIENADEIYDVIDIVEEELKKPEPRQSRLRNCITLLAPLISIANGVPTLVTNLQKLHDFILNFMR